MSEPGDDMTEIDIQIENEGVVRGMSRSMTTLVAIAGAVVSIWGLKMIAGFAGPVILAIVLVITVYPIRSWVERLPLPTGLGRILASVASIVIIYLVIAAILWSLVLSIEQLINLVPTYTPQFNNELNHLGDWLQRHGVSQQQINQGLSKLDIGQLVPILQSLAGQVKSFLTNLLLFAMVVIFTSFDAPGFVRQMRGEHDRHAEVADALDGFARGVRRYFAVSAGFGLICALGNWVALLWLGIPAAFVWGLLSFVTNFVPQVGFIIGLVPPALLALLDGGVSKMIIVIVAYVVINFVVQSLIQPKVVGDVLGLTATIAFLSLIFWAFVLGPLGAILALPMTLLAKAIFVDVDPANAWIQPLLSGEQAVQQSGPTANPLRTRLLRLKA
ncbi:MAG: AI-2E family transporter [Marmoricola sp.]